MVDKFINLLLNCDHEVQYYVAVSECLSTLKQVLQRDLAMHILIKWYGVRNAPGTQDISPAQEWQLFIGVLLGKAPATLMTWTLSSEKWLIIHL
jgi:hypothetical protein